MRVMEFYVSVPDAHEWYGWLFFSCLVCKYHFFDAREEERQCTAQDTKFSLLEDGRCARERESEAVGTVMYVMERENMRCCLRLLGFETELDVSLSPCSRTQSPFPPQPPPISTAALMLRTTAPAAAQ